MLYIVEYKFTMKTIESSAAINTSAFFFFFDFLRLLSAGRVVVVVVVGVELEMHEIPFRLLITTTSHQSGYNF